MGSKTNRLAGLALVLAAAGSPGDCRAAPGQPDPGARTGEDPLEDLRSPDPDARARGRAALAADAEGGLLAKALRAPEGLVREAAAAVVAENPARAVPLVRTALREVLRDRTTDGAARTAAARALGAAKDAGAVKDLRDALGDLGGDVALALAEIGDPAALPDLRARRAADPAAAPPEIGYALAVLGDPSGEDLLLERLAGPDAAASAAALHLLRRLTGRDLGSSVSLWKEAVRLRRLAAALGDPDWERSERAMVAETARGAAAGPDFLAVLQDAGASREARGKAALALGMLRCQEAGPALLDAARLGQDPWVRMYALEALGRMAWAPAAPVIARMLVNDEDLEIPKAFLESNQPFHLVQSAEIRALLDMGCEGALGAAVDEITRGGHGILPTACVGDFRIRVIYEAMAMLRKFGGPGAKDLFGFQPEAGEKEKAEAGARMVAWWRSRPADLQVEERARFDDPLFAARVLKEIEILGQYKFLEMDRSRRTLILLGHAAVPHLVAAVSRDAAADPAGQTRIGAAHALAAIGRPESAAPVRAALARAELPPVRCHLLTALAAIGPPGGVPEAVKALDSPLPDERAAAADALALCPTPGAAAALRKARARPGLDVVHRIRLASALLALRDASAVEEILGAMGAPDPVLRRRAWESVDRWVEGLGPFNPDADEPEAGAGLGDVRERWTAQKDRPRFRERTVADR
jgi:HEAT repeat protein